MKIKKRLKAFIFTKHLKAVFDQKQKILTEAVKCDGTMPRLYPNWLISIHPSPRDAAFCYYDGDIYHIFEYDTRDFNHYEVNNLEETVCYLLHYYARDAAICFAEQQATVKTAWDRDLALAKFYEYMELLGESYAKVAKEKMSSLTGYRI